MIEFSSPINMAVHLAGYISDPSTVRVRVLSEFGRAPTVEQCKNLIAEKRRQSERKTLRCSDRYYSRFRCGHDRAEENTTLGDDGIERCTQCEEKRQEDNRKEQLAHIERWKVYHKARKLKEERLAKMVKGAVTGREEEEKIASGVMADVMTLFGVSEAKHNTIRGADIKAVAAMLLRRRGLSFPMIARQLGYKDHTSVVHLCQTFPRRAEREPKLLEALGVLK